MHGRTITDMMVVDRVTDPVYVFGMNLPNPGNVSQLSAQYSDEFMGQS